jgi:hypothetical protein
MVVFDLCQLPEQVATESTILILLRYVVVRFVVFRLMLFLVQPPLIAVCFDAGGQSSGGDSIPTCARYRRRRESGVGSRGGGGGSLAVRRGGEWERNGRAVGRGEGMSQSRDNPFVVGYVHRGPSLSTRSSVGAA